MVITHEWTVQRQKYNFSEQVSTVINGVIFLQKTTEKYLKHWWGHFPSDWWFFFLVFFFVFLWNPCFSLDKSWRQTHPHFTVFHNAQTFPGGGGGGVKFPLSPPTIHCFPQHFHGRGFPLCPYHNTFTSLIYHFTLHVYIAVLFRCQTPDFG